MPSDKTLTLPPGASRRRLSPDEVQARVRATLDVDNPADNTARLSLEREGQIQLRVTDIDPYDRNPRREQNALYYEIKESIRVARVISPLTVTKRPGATRFMVCAGGNTRLRAQQELWAETRDPKFEFLLVTYRPWVSEAQVMVAHLVENELHAGMSFWDKATGVWDLKAELERERGATLSLRALNEAIREKGLAVSITILSFYGFALDQLADLGPARALLSKRTVRELQPAFAFLASYLSAHDRADEWPTVRRQVLHQRGEAHRTAVANADRDDIDRRAATLDAVALITQLEQAVAEAVGEPVARLREVRTLQRSLPEAKLPELVETVRAGITREDTDEAAARREPPPRNTRTRSTPSPAPEAPESAVEKPAPSAPSPHERTDTAPVATTDPLADAQQAAIEFAQACELDELLQLCADMPCGFYVEVPADGAALDLDDRAPRYGGWWIAAMLAEQIEGSYAERLPTDSLWRRVQLQEDGCDPGTLEWTIQTILGGAPGLAELGHWLTRSPEAVMRAYQTLLDAVRALRSASPERFLIDAEAS